MITKVKISGYRIFKYFEFRPHQNLNLIVGANETGKSTLLEAIALGLTGRINGRRAAEELNPYWFNTEVVDKFVSDRQAGKKVAPPEMPWLVLALRLYSSLARPVLTSRMTRFSYNPPSSR